MKNQNTPKKKWKTWHKVILAIVTFPLIIVVIIAIALPNTETGTKTTDAETTPKKWKDMQYEEREAWIKQALNNHNSHSTEFEVAMAKSIKNQFNYPQEVDFNFGEYPLLKNGDVVDADTGFVFFRGRGTAKNAFGIKSEFVYQIRTVIRPDTAYIDNVSVNEAK